MLRLTPRDTDTLYQCHMVVLRPVDKHPTGPRGCATFAGNFLEAADMIRRQYGDDHVESVQINSIFEYDYTSGERIVVTHFDRYATLPPLAEAG